MKKDGKEVYNTAKFHGKSAVEDLILVSDYFSGDNKAKESDQIKFAHQAVKAAVQELDEFLKDVSGDDKVKESNSQSVNLYRDIQINLQ